MLYISANTKFIYSNNKVIKQTVFIFNEILYKFRNIYRHDTIAQRKMIIVTSKNKYYGVKESIYTSKDLFDLVVNNLISNAVKYSHWGTNIYVSCEKPTPNSNHHILSVTDYGLPIFEDEIETDKIYKLFYRSEMAIEADPTGDGIGLFVAKRLLDRLGHDIKHKQEKISDYHLPFLNEYVRRCQNNDRIRLQRDEHLKAIEEHNGLSNSSQINYQKMVTNMSDFYSNDRKYNFHIDVSKKSDYEIIKFLKTPTYKITAEVTIWDK